MYKIKDFYTAYVKAIKEINSERKEGENWLNLIKKLTYEKKEVADAIDNVGENLAAIAKYFSKDDYERYVKHVIRMTNSYYYSENNRYSKIIRNMYERLMSYYGEAKSFMIAKKYSEIKNVYKDAIEYVCEQEHIYNIENSNDSLRYKFVFGKNYVYSK